MKQLRRISAIARIVGIVILLGVVVVAAYQLYVFYSDKVGFTPDKAVETYFNALAQGDYEQVYQLTEKEHLTDIYGRRITQGEFIEQLDQLTGGQRLPFQRIEVKKLFQQQGVFYYEVLLHSSVGGEAGQSRVLVEVQRVNNTWVVTYPFAIVL